MYGAANDIRKRSRQTSKRRSDIRRLAPDFSIRRLCARDWHVEVVTVIRWCEVLEHRARIGTGDRLPVVLSGFLDDGPGLAQQIPGFAGRVLKENIESAV